MIILGVSTTVNSSQPIVQNATINLQILVSILLVVERLLALKSRLGTSVIVDIRLVSPTEKEQDLLQASQHPQGERISIPLMEHKFSRRDSPVG